MPGVSEWSTKVAGWVGGPHTRSSWRASAYTSQMRWTGAANSASMIRVRLSMSCLTSVTGMSLIPLEGGGVCDQVVDAGDASAPDGLELAEHRAHRADGFHVAAGQCLAPAASLGDETGTLQDGNVLQGRGTT